MTLQYPAILDMSETGRRFAYTERDAMLYALGIGLGGDPLKEDELKFVYEDRLKAIPTLATVVAWDVGVPTSQLGVDYRLVVHAEEEVILHKPMPGAARIVADSSISDVFDRGAGKGAIIVRKTILRLEDDLSQLATLRRVLFARGDGGFGGPEAQPPPLTAMNNRPADMVMEYHTAQNQALIFRLCGDRNPLHIAPERARQAGFERPILHGLCTFGFTCRAVVEAFCDFEPGLVASHRARFSAPVYPGETLRISLWRDADEVVFEADVVERSARVIRSGRSVLRQREA